MPRVISLRPTVPGSSRPAQTPRGVEVGRDLFNGYGGELMDHMISAADYYHIHHTNKITQPGHRYGFSNLGFYGYSADDVLSMGVEIGPFYCAGTRAAVAWQPDDPLNRLISLNNHGADKDTSFSRVINTAEGWPYKLTFDARRTFGEIYPFEVILNGEVIATFDASDHGDWESFELEFMGTHTGPSLIAFRSLSNDVPNAPRSAVAFDNLEFAAGTLYEDGTTSFEDETYVADIPNDHFRIFRTIGANEDSEYDRYLVYFDGKLHTIAFPVDDPNYFRDSSREYHYLTLDEIRTAVNLDEIEMDRFEKFAEVGQAGYETVYGPGGPRYDPAYQEDPLYIF